jgi:hypothetical protein
MFWTKMWWKVFWRIGRVPINSHFLNFFLKAFFEPTCFSFQWPVSTNEVVNWWEGDNCFRDFCCCFCQFLGKKEGTLHTLIDLIH